MNENVKTNGSPRILIFVALVCVSLAPVLNAEKDKDAALALPSNQKQFVSAKEGADTLVQAAATFDQNALNKILGPAAGLL
jgi:hypothetical protein